MHRSFLKAILAVAACFASFAAAASAATDTSAALTWTGEITAGSGTITLAGDDMDEIIDQIHAVDSSHNATPNLRSVAGTSIVKDVACGIFATAGKRDFMILQYRLRELGGDCKVPARTCLRLSCRNTSGIYVCNDNDHEVTRPCATFGDFASKVAQGCCTSSVVKSKALSGQAFSDEGWNVCAAYANCNHASTADAPSHLVMPGPNGECRN